MQFHLALLLATQSRQRRSPCLLRAHCALDTLQPVPLLESTTSHSEHLSYCFGPGQRRCIACVSWLWSWAVHSKQRNLWTFTDAGCFASSMSLVLRDHIVLSLLIPALWHWEQWKTFSSSDMPLEPAMRAAILGAGCVQSTQDRCARQGTQGAQVLLFCAKFATRYLFYIQ